MVGRTYGRAGRTVAVYSLDRRWEEQPCFRLSRIQIALKRVVANFGIFRCFLKLIMESSGKCNPYPR